MSAYMYLVAKEGEGFSMYLEEGNFTRNNALLTDSGIAGGGSFAAQLSDGDLVQIYANASTDRVCQKSASGLEIGYLDGDPVGALPAASANSGAYTRRKGNVVLMGGRVHKVKLDAANQAITAGDSLAIDTTNKNAFDKEEDTTSNVIALESAGASSGASILAFVVGVPTVEADAGA